MKIVDKLAALRKCCQLDANHMIEFVQQVKRMKGGNA